MGVETLGQITTEYYMGQASEENGTARVNRP